MNIPDTLQTITAEIEATEKLYADACGAVVEVAQERARIEAAISAAKVERDEALKNLGDALARARVGAAGTDEEAEARAAFEAADAALTKARGRESEGEAAETSMTVAGLERRQVALAETLRDLSARQHR